MVNHDYIVWIRWGGNPSFQMPIGVEGSDLYDAAKRRVALLDQPGHYDDVLVHHQSNHGTAEIFLIRDLTSRTKRKPRYGWPR